MKCKKTIRFLSFALAGILLVGSPMQAFAADQASGISKTAESSLTADDNKNTPETPVPPSDSGTEPTAPETPPAAVLPDDGSESTQKPSDTPSADSTQPSDPAPPQNDGLVSEPIQDPDNSPAPDNPPSSVPPADEGTTQPPTTPAANADISSIHLDYSELPLALNGSPGELTATVLDADGNEILDALTFTWSCDNNNVIDLSGNGSKAEITAKNTGEAIVTVKTGDVTATCKVKVIIPITDLTLNASTLSMKRNQTKKLSGSIIPSNTTEDRTLTWSSSNPNVVAVDAGGTLRALSGGTAVITAKTSNGLEKTCTVTVSNDTYKTGWQYINNRWYYYNSDGDMQTGWQQVGGKFYYMNSNGIMLTGWQKLDGKWYYLNPSGDRKSGWLWLNNHWYYLDSNGIMLTGMIRVGNASYYCNSSGEMLTGWQRVNGRWRYFDGSGAMKTGWQWINNAWYYMDPNGDMLTGWMNLGRDRYYLTSSGAMLTGWGRIDNKWYYFDGSGHMLTNWIQLGNTWYYLDQNGVMQTGWHKIGNIQYYFTSSGNMQTGWGKINNSWYYFNSSGAKQTGWTQVGSTWYYLDSNGAMQTGWLKLGGVWYYLNSGGAMQTGWQRVDGNWYYFNNQGIMQTGWQPIGGSWYYLNPDGSMKTGWMKVNDVWYYFTDSGAMATSDTTIDGQVNSFSSSGIWEGVVSSRIRAYGIDVSSHQGYIHWNRVADTNVDFAMIRIVTNSGAKDTTFEANYNGARNAGIKVGVYKYSYASTRREARKEAATVLDALNGRSLNYPIVLDMEDSSILNKTDSNSRRSEIVLAFKEEVEAQGYKFALYANLTWLNRYLDMNMLKDVDIWVARYRSLNSGHGYTGKGNVVMWQYSSTGSVSGINGNVDLNVSYKKY